MTTNLGNVQTVAIIKQRELELKAHGYDVMREIETLQSRLNVLNAEKNTVIKEVQKIYTFLENAKQQIQEQQIQKQNVEHQIVSPTPNNVTPSQESMVIVEKQSNIPEDEVQSPAPVRRAKQRTRKKSTRNK